MGWKSGSAVYIEIVISYDSVNMKRTIIPIRFVLVLSTFMLTVLLYVDRSCISAAKGDICSDPGFSMTDFGWIMAVFTLGYALFQTPAGKLADTRGPRRVIPKPCRTAYPCQQIAATCISKICFEIQPCWFHYSPKGTPPGQYDLRLKLFSNYENKDVFLALDSNLLDRNNYYKIATVKINNNE